MIFFSFSLLQFSSPHLFTSLWYSSPRLLASSISLCLSLLQSYLCLVDITLPILVTIIFSFTLSSSTCPDSVASLCRNRRHNYPCLFTSSWYSSLFLFASSIPLHISLSRLSLRIVDITSPKFVTIAFYLSWFLCFSLSQSPAQLSLSLHPLVIFLSFFYLPCQYHFIYTCRDCLFASLISLRLSFLQSSSTCPDHLLLVRIIS